MKTLIAVPCMDMLHTQFHTSMMGLRLANIGSEIEYANCVTSLIYDARNRLAHKAVIDGFDRVVWFDSDMVFDSDVYERFHARLDEGYDIVSGLYFTRKEPVAPVAYKELAFEKDGDYWMPKAIPYDNYPENEPYAVEACGFGGIAMKTKVLEDIKNEFGPPFNPNQYYGEDISFCQRARALGYEIFVDPAIKLAHMAMVPITEETFKRGFI